MWGIRDSEGNDIMCLIFPVRLYKFDPDAVGRRNLF